MPAPTVFLAYHGIQILDVTGPCSVLGGANDLLGRRAYEIVVTGPKAGRVRSNCGVELGCNALGEIAPDGVDMFFIPGGEREGLTAMIADTEARDWTVTARGAARRYGSICTGSVVLAAWGLVDGRRFASHWQATRYLRRTHPALDLDAEAIFVEDGPLWTSAGVTTGIDMMLAIVERDHGAEAARHIAQRLVLSVRRPGTQSQFSPLLAAQAGREGRYRDLIGWIALNLEKPLGVEALAEHAGETLRSFHRNFVEATGQSPAAFVTQLRLDRARTLIVDGHALKTVAAQAGFPDVARLSAAFRRRFGMTANEYRVVHAA
ncbi:GlxA family transcriptional regulator [Sphingomonas cavernae]|nr:DJ-1/PfpI family protein [Sphingomonas cavernae]